MRQKCLLRRVLSLNIEKWLIDLITDFVSNSELNRFSPEGEEKIWEKPLVGFSKGDDPYYDFYKKDIGEFYLTPEEFFNKAKEDNNSDKSMLSIVSWVLPQSAVTRADNKENKSYPAVRWVKARSIGEEFNKKLAEYVVAQLEGSGICSVAPIISPVFERKQSDKYGFASNWSERHAAFISGLGTFGLCDGLITAAGKAIRCGSVIFKSSVTPTIRKYEKYNEYCLYYSKGICMKCAERCPAGAIDRNGHDKNKCSKYQRDIIGPYTVKEYGLKSTCCGLCQTDVPCESRIPGR